MDATKIYAWGLNAKSLDKIVEWYDQGDKSWIYCDCPLDHDYSNVRYNIETHLNTSFADLEDKTRVIYYSIEADCHQIGFAIVRKKFDYFNNVLGYSIGLDIPEGSDRGNGYGTIAIRKLLYALKNNKNMKANEIYLETLSYNKPAMKIADRLGFELVKERELGEEYQREFANHICDIACCLNVEAGDLQEETVKALLYKINLNNWPNIELRKITEADKGLFDSIELYGEKRDYADPSFFDYESTEQTIRFAFYENNALVGGITTEFNVDNYSCEIEDFFIDEKYHGCGYGRKSLYTIIDYIKSNQKFKVDKILLDVHTTNIDALALYWKAGFRPTNYDTFKNLWYMELKLSSI